MYDRWEIEQSASTTGTKGENAGDRDRDEEEGCRAPGRRRERKAVGSARTGEAVDRSCGDGDGDGGAAASGEAEGRRRRRRCSGGSEERRCSLAMADRGWRYARDV